MKKIFLTLVLSMMSVVSVLSQDSLWIWNFHYQGYTNGVKVCEVVRNQCIATGSQERIFLGQKCDSLFLYITYAKDYVYGGKKLHKTGDTVTLMAYYINGIEGKFTSTVPYYYIHDSTSGIGFKYTEDKSDTLVFGYTTNPHYDNQYHYSEDNRWIINSADPSAEIIEKVINVSSLQVFPNPVQDIINIKFDSKESTNKVEIYNLNGVLIYSEDSEVFGENRLTIDISDFVSGYYFVKVDNVTTKFIKL